jgi:hypothetical protein
MSSERLGRIAPPSLGCLSVLPGFLVDLGTSGKERVRLATDLLRDIQRGTGSWFLVGQRFMHEQPRAAQTLQAGDVARLGDVLTGQ